MRLSCIWGGPKKPKFIYKKSCTYSYMVKLQSPSKYSPFDSTHLSRHFLFPLLKIVFDLVDFDPVSHLPLFVSPLPHRQTVSPWGLLSSKETKESHLGWQPVNREDGAQGHAVFGQKLLNSQGSAGRCAPKSHIMKRTNALKVFQKFTEAKCSLSQHHQLVHWYRWIPRTLT